MEKEKRDQNIKVRLTLSEKKHFENLVEKYGVKNISDFIRNVILKGSYEVKTKKCEDNENSILYHLFKIGNNLNQIAKHCNIEKKIDTKVLSELQKIREYLEILTG